MTLEELLQLKGKDPKAALALIERTRPVSLMGVDVVNMPIGEMRRYNAPEERAYFRRIAAYHGICTCDDLKKEFI